MLCKVNTDDWKVNALQKKMKQFFFKNSTLSRHADFDDYKVLLQAPKLRTDMNVILKKGDSKKDAAATVLLKLVRCLATKYLLFTKYESLLSLCPQKT